MSTPQTKMEIESPTGEAGFSVNFRLFDSHGIETQFTLRCNAVSDWANVLKARKAIVDECLKYGWTVHGNTSAAQATQSQPQAKLDGNGSQYLTFDASQIIKTFDDAGELRIKVKGKPFDKFGVPVYEEDLHILGVDLEAMPPGTHQFNHRVKALLKEDGKTPRKIVEVLR